MTPVKLSEIHFGERDALHEFMKQDRENIAILDNSFVVPPRVRMSELETGARFLVLGPKGSGKTTLLWHLKRKATESRNKIILFKSELRKEDRDRLDRMVDLVVVEDQKGVRFDSDYKTVWEWYLLKNVFGLIQREDIFEGHALYYDIRSLLNVKENRINTIYDNFHIESAKGKIKLAFGYGPLKSELSGEVDARRKDDQIDFLDLVRLVQSVVGKIVLEEGVSIRLFIDELEFFMSHEGDGERDRRLVRDLVFAINSVNSLFSRSGSNVTIVASLRSEILQSISSSGQEVEKVVDAFGVKLNWFHDNIEEHSVLRIFENKIRYSEVMLRGEYTHDVWKTYFPTQVNSKPVKNYLLDMGLHRPRGVVLRLLAALELSHDSYAFTERSFIDSEEAFGRYMLTEFADEIAAAYDEKESDQILALFRGFSFAFDASELQQRVRNLESNNRQRGAKPMNLRVEPVIRFLYRIGMIGNQFDLQTESGHWVHRNLWSFRGDVDPILSKRFVLHQSIRTVLQTL